MLEDLNESKLNFSLIKGLIDINDIHYKNNLFYQRILILVNRNENSGKKIFDKIKEDLINCINKVNKFELIENYYKTFLENEKKDIIPILEEKLKEFQRKNLNEIVIMNEQNIIPNKEFNFEEAIQESKNLKYIDSSFFMIIYNEKKDSKYNESTDKEILNESIKEFQDTFKRIIQLNETKEPFFEIPYVEKILNVISTKEDDDNFKNEIFWKKNFKT